MRRFRKHLRTVWLLLAAVTQFTFAETVLSVTTINDVPWPKRSDIDVVIAREKVWLYGGTRDKHYRDRWVSNDGLSWTEVKGTDDTLLPICAALLYHQDKFWLLGGRTEPHQVTGVPGFWVSSDFSEWQMVQESPPWGKREVKSLLAKGDNAFLIDGTTFFPQRGSSLIDYHWDVWQSRDMQQWKQISSKPPWYSGYHLPHTACVFEDKIWLVADTKSDTATLWNSIDGGLWQKIVPELPCHDGRIITMMPWGGRLCLLAKDGACGQVGIWTSQNGQDWIKSSIQGDFPDVQAAAVVEHQGKVLIIGGFWSESKKSHGVTVLCTD